MTRSMKISSGCGVCLTLFGIVVLVGVVYRIITVFTRFDILVAVSAVVSVLFLSLFIVPGVLLTLRHGFSAAIGVACLLIGMWMAGILMTMLWVITTGGMSFFETEFYSALPFFLAIGFVVGLVITCFGYGTYDMNTSKKTQKSPAETPSEA